MVKQEEVKQGEEMGEEEHSDSPEKPPEEMDEEGDNTDEEQASPAVTRARRPRVRNAGAAEGSREGGDGNGDDASGSTELVLADGAAPWESPSAEQVKMMVQHLSPRGRDDDDTAEIRVGKQYQCPVPAVRPRAEQQADERVGQLVWDPKSMPPDRVVSYLERSATVRHPAEFPSDAALMHLHRCGYDVNAAVDGLPSLSDASLPDVKQLDAWSTEDVRQFEEGVTRFGKDFRRIQIHMERKFPVSMVILYYFARWKKCPNFRVWQGRWKDYNKDECENCGKGGELLCCDGCPAAYHVGCCHPPYSSIAGVPDADWFCMACVLRRKWMHRCRTSLPSGSKRSFKPSSFSHTPDGTLNMGVPFSPAARFIPRGGTPEVEDLAADAETDNDAEGGVDEQPMVQMSRGAASAVVPAPAAATTFRESPDVPVAFSAASAGTSTSSGSRRQRTISAGIRGSSELTSSGEDEVENVGGARGTKRNSRGPGTPAVDDAEQLAATATGGAMVDLQGTKTHGTRTSPVANMGPFSRGEVLAVRADPEEDAIAPFWVCAVYGTRKRELEASWCVRESRLLLIDH